MFFHRLAARSIAAISDPDGEDPDREARRPDQQAGRHLGRHAGRGQQEDRDDEIGHRRHIRRTGVLDGLEMVTEGPTVHIREILREFHVDEVDEEERGPHEQGGDDRRQPGRPHRIRGVSSMKADFVGRFDLGDVVMDLRHDGRSGRPGTSHDREEGGADLAGRRFHGSSPRPRPPGSASANDSRPSALCPRAKYALTDSGSLDR